MIVGKIAALLDDRTLVINKGSQDGVKMGMRFTIYAAEGKKIVDPDTKKELGFLKLSKLSVEVTELYPSYAKAETYKYKTINEGGENSIFGSLGYLAPPKYVKKYETFSIEERTKKEINEERSIVKVGDLAEEMEDVKENR